MGQALPFRIAETPTREPLPARLTAKDMMRIFGIGRSWFYELEREGRFDAFRLRPTIGRVMYSGRLVQQYLDGELSFGRPRAGGR